MRWIARNASLAIAAVMLAASAPALAEGAGTSNDLRVPLPAIEAARAGTVCIADPATMRRDHPSMLKHQRDETVHGGIRGAKASLKGCIDCHASAKTTSVAAAPGDFCQSCHGYAAVKIDCFECHSAKPATTVARQP